MASDVATSQSLFRLAAALENATPRNMFATTARPLTATTEINGAKTEEQRKKEAEDEGGDISFSTAQGIKHLLYGTRMFMVDPDWKKAHFIRRPIDGPFGYGLITPRDKARGLMMAIQAQFIQIILSGGDDDNQTALDPAKVAARLKILYEWKQRKFLLQTMAKILWRAGDKKRACIVTLHPKNPGLLYSEQKRLEYFMRTVKVFECSTLKQLMKVLEKKFPMFESHEGGGALMFLYSLILSRTVQKLEEDLQGEFLLTSHDQCSLAMINLVLTGTATPYLFNGVQEYDMDSTLLEVKRHGVKERAEIGMLVVDRLEGKEARNAKKITIGSMLKTPIYPIWVLRLKGRYSVFFCCNLSLNRDWRSESRFTLYLYNGQSDQKEQARLTIDSRLRLRTDKQKDDKTVPLVDECILSRWPGAHIDWNGTSPFF